MDKESKIEHKFISITPVMLRAETPETEVIIGPGIAEHEIERWTPEQIAEMKWYKEVEALTYVICKQSFYGPIPKIK